MDDKFSWTQAYKRSWEDTKGLVKTGELIFHREFNTNKKNIIRHLLVCIDTSAAIEKTDYVPTIRNTIVNNLSKFAQTFKHANPLSCLNFLTCKDTFEKYSSEFDSQSFLNIIGSGYFSFLNCLKAGLEFLKDSSYKKEMLIITSSTGTKDIGSYDEVLKDIKKAGIKISIISICGEIMLFKKVSSMTSGIFQVPTNHSHFEIILNTFSEPLESVESTSCLIKLGFPKLLDISGICTCHLTFHKSCYECPSCKTFVCQLPCQCPICALQLVSPINISKSYYFMYPLHPLDQDTTGECRKCGNPSATKCNDCQSFYCEECNLFIQQELNFCIFCT